MTWNEAIAYLMNNHGKKLAAINYTAINKAHSKIKERKAALNDEKYKTYTYNIPPISSPDYFIHLLLTQYNYGMAAKKDLHSIAM